MRKNLETLWNEKLKLDQHSENTVIQAKEWDSLAVAILKVSGETTNLTAEEIEAVNWAKSRMGQ